MYLLSALFQCGIFIIVPAITFGFGIRNILLIDEKYRRISVAGLIGFIFFEESVIGLIIDPRSIHISFSELIFTSGLIGILAFLFVLLFSPVAISILRIFKRQ